MPVIPFDHHEFLFDGESDVWLNLVVELRRVRGVEREDLAGDLAAATGGVAFDDDVSMRLTCVLDRVTPSDVRRTVRTILGRGGASADVEWRYELAPPRFERLGPARA